MAPGPKNKEIFKKISFESSIFLEKGLLQAATAWPIKPPRQVSFCTEGPVSTGSRHPTFRMVTSARLRGPAMPEHPTQVSLTMSTPMGLDQNSLGTRPALAKAPGQQRPRAWATLGELDSEVQVLLRQPSPRNWRLPVPPPPQNS